MIRFRLVLSILVLVCMLASLSALPGCGGDDSSEENGGGEAAENQQDGDDGDSVIDSDGDGGEVDGGDDEDDADAEDDIDGNQDGHDGDDEDSDTDNGSTGEETLAEILGHISGVNSVKYDMVVTSEQGTFDSTQWLEGNKQKVELFSQEGTVVNLMDMDQMVAYTYVEGQDYYTKLDFNKVGDTVIDQAESLEEYDIVLMGTEIRDGKDCLVIQYDTYQDGDPVTIKMWIWKLHGLPIRSETKIDGALEIVIEWNDFEFGDIPDSIFELPSDMEELDLTQYGLS